MWFTSEPSLRMSSFKTKIRRRKYALSRGGDSRGGGPPPPRNVSGENAGSSSKDAAPEWEFVNFNPVIYGRGGRPLSQPPPLPADTGLVMTAPALPPRELPPLMPPPRPPSFCTPSSPESPHDAAAGTVIISLDLLELKPATLQRGSHVHTMIESTLLYNNSI
jgi:hypothetical protein